MKAVIYARCSSDAQTENSIEGVVRLVQDQQLMIRLQQAFFKSVYTLELLAVLRYDKFVLIIRKFILVEVIYASSSYL